MPQKVTGPDGKQYYDGGAAGMIPAEDVEGPPAPGMFQRLGQGLYNAAPELAAGASSFLAPETGGLSLAIPPIAAMATEAGKEYHDTGTVDPTTVLKRGAFNAIPGVVTGALRPILGSLMRDSGPALDAMASGKGNVVSTVAKGAKALLPGAADTAKAGTEGTIDSVSPQGLQYAKNRVLDLARQGKAFGDSEFDAAQSLYEHLSQALTQRGPAQLARDAGIPFVDTAARAADAAKAKAGQISLRLRQLLQGTAAVGGSTGALEGQQ